MQRSIISIIIALLSLPILTHSQNAIYSGAILQSVPSPLPYTHLTSPTIGGRFLPSIGEVKTFILFIRFADDVATSGTWPNAAVLSPMAENLLAPSISPNGNYSPHSITHYIYENSYGKLHIYGDEYYITLPHSEATYYAMPLTVAEIRQVIQTDALNQLPIQYPNINLSQYDNWVGLGTPYNSAPGNDGIVDLYWMVLRNLSPSSPIGEDHALVYVSKTIGGVTLESGMDFGTNGYEPGSGITIFSNNGNVNTNDQNTIIKMPVDESTNDGNHITIIGTMMHELSHRFFGGGHFGSCGNYPFPTFDGYSSWYGSSSAPAYVVSSGAAYGNFSGYERYRLGWITSSDIKVIESNDVSNLVIKDLSTQVLASNTYKLVRIKLDDEQSIFIENRSQKSIYDAHYSPMNCGYILNPGLLFYLIPVERENFSETPMNIICANGKWNWHLVSGGSQSLPVSTDVLEKTTPNVETGYDDTQYIHPWPNSGSYLSLYNPLNNSVRYGRWYKGDTYKDETHMVADVNGTNKQIFAVGDVITKWSNGSSHKWDPVNCKFISTEFGIHIAENNLSTGDYTINIVSANAESLPPSRPQKVIVRSNTGVIGGNNRVEWLPNWEPDVVSYEVSRKVVSWPGVWEVVATLSVNYTYWVDPQYCYAPGGGDFETSYRIRAIDGTNKYSSYSDIAKERAEALYKRHESMISNSVLNYSMDQNYPNPFNPSTTLSFTLPEDGYVTIKVYDIVGREMATVVDGYKSAGKYNIPFDASNLSSGFYIYKIQAGMYSATKKMQLLK